jgi:hypothetical protein
MDNIWSPFMLTYLNTIVFNFIKLTAESHYFEGKGINTKHSFTES